MVKGTENNSGQDIKYTKYFTEEFKIFLIIGSITRLRTKFVFCTFGFCYQITSTTNLKKINRSKIVKQLVLCSLTIIQYLLFIRLVNEEEKELTTTKYGKNLRLIIPELSISRSW